MNIQNAFAFHPATEVTGPVHDQVRELLKDTALKLEKLTPECPEQTQALNQIRVAMFWANAAVACHSNEKAV